MRYRPFSGTRAVIALMLREMATTYGRSPGGYVWTILEPVGGIALMTLVFTVMLRSPPLGSNFALFYASGFMPFMTYTTIASRVGAAIRYSRPLLAYPAITYIDTVLSRFLLALLTGVLVFALVIGGIGFVFAVDIDPDYPRLFNAFAMLSALGLGFGLINCYLFGVFTIWEQIWSILNRPLFIISGLFFVIDAFSERIRDILLWNPLAHVVMEARAGIYPTYDGRYVSPLYVYGISAVCIVCGLLLLRRHVRFLISEGA